MPHDYATVVRDGYEVPLIGVPRHATILECDCCHDEFPQAELEMNDTGNQFLCKKCRTEGRS